jgi:hypothetical protein
MEPWLKQPLDLTGRLHRHCVGLATGESSGYSVSAPPARGPGPRAGPGLRVSGSSGPGPGRGSVARLGQLHFRSVAVASAGGFRGSAAACAAARWRPQSRPRPESWARGRAGTVLTGTAAGCWGGGAVHAQAAAQWHGWHYARPTARAARPLTEAGGSTRSRGGPTQVNGIFRVERTRSMESARCKFGAARAIGHCYAA